MKNLMGRKAVFLGLLATSAVAVLPALAQEAGRSGILSMSIGTNAGRNLDLDPGGDDTSAELTGRLGYDYSLNTANQQLRFSAQVNPKISDEKDGRPLPKFTFDYKQRGARSELSLNGLYQRTEVSDQSIGYDDSGSVFYYDGTGERTLARAGAKFTGGLDRPFGYSISASHTDVSYSDVTAGSYYDSRRDLLQLDLSAELSAMTMLSFSGGYQEYEVDNPTELSRRSRTALVGISQRLDPVTQAVFTVGRSNIESSRTTGSKTEDGTTFGLILSREDQRGGSTFSLGRSITETGARDEVIIARTNETAFGDFKGQIGVSRGASDEADVIAGLTYALELPRDKLNLSLSRTVTTDDDGLDVVLTRVSGSLTHALGDVNSVNFGLTASTTERDVYDTTRVTASVAYSHSLSPDADVTAGVRMSMATRTGREDADSQSVFVTLNRQFQTLR